MVKVGLNEGKKQWLILKSKKKVSGIAPLQPLTLAPFRAWGVKQELVVPLATKVGFFISERKMVFEIFLMDGGVIGQLVQDDHVTKLHFFPSDRCATFAVKKMAQMWPIYCSSTLVVAIK